MRNILFIFSFILYLNGYFAQSIFLNKLHKIDTIDVVYQDAHGNRIEEKAKIGLPIFKEIFLVFSEEKQNNSPRHIRLRNPRYIRSLHVKYTDKKNNPFEKIINFYNQKISNDLYVYEDRNYIYDFNNLFNKNKSYNTKQTLILKTKTDFNFKRISKTNLLKILYDEDDKYFYLYIKNCKIIKACDKIKYIKHPLSKKAIFKFKLNGDYSQMIKNNRFSRYIKRIQIGFNKNRSKNNHLVIESKSKQIRNITRMYFNEDNMLVKFNKNEISNKQFFYRIGF